VANRRDEQVPATVTTKQGGCTYSNFDTDPSILGTAVYPCNIDLAENVPAKVKQYAGRMNGSDIRYTFTDADNNNANIMDALAALVKNYESSLVAVQGEENSTGGGGGGGDDGGGEEEPGDATGGGGLCDIVTAGASSGFTINGNTSTSKGSVTVNGTTYTCCLKMESATSITFKTTVPSTLTLVFESKETGKKVKIDGVDYTTNSSAKVVAELAEGNHEIKKGDSINLFYLALSSQATGIQEIQFDSEMQIYLLSGRKIYQGKSDNIETIITKHGKQGVYVIKSKGESKKIVLH
jgi:pectate lyase